jgi:hypothetical protein
MHCPSPSQVPGSFYEQQAIVYVSLKHLQKICNTQNFYLDYLQSTHCL